VPSAWCMTLCITIDLLCTNGDFVRFVPIVLCCAAMLQLQVNHNYARAKVPATSHHCSVAASDYAYQPGKSENSWKQPDHFICYSDILMILTLCSFAYLVCFS